MAALRVKHTHKNVKSHLLVACRLSGEHFNNKPLHLKILQRLTVTMTGPLKDLHKYWKALSSLTCSLQAALHLPLKQPSNKAFKKPLTFPLNKQNRKQPYVFPLSNPAFPLTAALKKSLKKPSTSPLQKSLEQLYSFPSSSPAPSLYY